MGVEFSEAPVDFATLFSREAPVTLEIGFGMGASRGDGESAPGAEFPRH